MWISRSLEATLLRAVHQRPVVVVTGARQVGKAILCRCQNAYPLGDGIEAGSLGEVERLLLS